MLTAQRTPSLFDLPDPAQSLFDLPGGEPTLDEAISSTWEGLTAHKPRPCPVCGGDMRPEYGVHARPIGGRCAACDTTLS